MSDPQVAVVMLAIFVLSIMLALAICRGPERTSSPGRSPSFHYTGRRARQRPRRRRPQGEICAQQIAQRSARNRIRMKIRKNTGSTMLRLRYVNSTYR